jgi:hypothetical protein
MLLSYRLPANRTKTPRFSELNCICSIDHQFIFFTGFFGKIWRFAIVSPDLPWRLADRNQKVCSNMKLSGKVRENRRAE